MGKFDLYDRDINGEQIPILVSERGRNTCTVGPLHKGHCGLRGADDKCPTRYSTAAMLLDAVLVNKNVNALCSENTVYGEYTDPDSSKIYRFLCEDGNRVSYEKEALPDNLATMPFVLYAIRNASEIDEMKEQLKLAADDYSKTGFVDEKIILCFCDCFKYGFTNTLEDDVSYEENGLVLDTVRAAVKTGMLESVKVFGGMSLAGFTGVNINEGKKTVAKMSNEEYMEKIKAGDAVIPYGWNEKQRTRVPALLSLENFVAPTTFFSLMTKITKRMENVMLRLDAGIEGVDAIGKDYVNLFITGKPGTGKTTLAYALGAATGMPVYTVPMTKNTEEDVFQGMNKVIDGSLQFVSTDFLDAYTNGGIIVLEEINLPDPSVVMGSIGQAVEFPFTLMKDGYVPVKRHPLCIIIGTMNIGTYGSKGVNQALSSRFRQTYTLNDPTKEEFINILVGTGAKKKDAQWVFNAYNKINEYLTSPAINAEDVCLNVTLRGCIGALENIDEGEDAKDAIRNTLVGKISEIDLELANNVYENVVMPLPDLM